jgi:ribose-phosphate pyrophosphokinase
MTSPVLLHFEEDTAMALALAKQANLHPYTIGKHRFPDGELKLRLPTPLPTRVVVLRSLHQPNEKLVELMLIASEARALGASHLTLVAPYLAYMRQDMAFQPGEVVSQRVVGQFLAHYFDALITVDPHLHRVATLQEAAPVAMACVLSGAPVLAEFIAQKVGNPLLIGPDAESAQWIGQAAAVHGFDHGVCTKHRHGDHHVDTLLPHLNFAGRHVVLLDDIASSGHTLASAARLALAAGAASVDVAVTHALFAAGAMEVIKAAGIREVWSTDCVTHSSNAVSITNVLATALVSQQPESLPK